MKNVKSKRVFLTIIILTIITIAGLWTFGVDNAVYVNYYEFNHALENGEIKKVKIKADTIEFQTGDDDKLYYTDSPNSDGFKEKLLLAGVEVEDYYSAEETFIFITDLIFYVFFFGIIGFAIYKLVSAYSSTFKVVKRTGITFRDIAGMNKLKADMKYAVDILKYPEKYKQKGIRPTKGIILEGPPGNGKTLFAKALAQEAGVSFIATKGADFQSALMSMGAKKLNVLFAKARRHKPCIIFIDEFDSIGERRNYAGSGIDKENNRLITTLLSEMDGFSSEDGILVIAATNSYNSLDAALVRPGRFDLKYTISNPDKETREALIRLYTSGKTLGDDVKMENLVRAFEGMSCSAIETIINEASVSALMKEKNSVDMECIVSACEKMNLTVIR